MKFEMRALAPLAVLCSATVAQAEDYKVLVLQALTGGAAPFGVSFTDGIKLAAEEINASGALGEGNTLELVIVDDATDRTQTMSLMSRYAADSDILAVLGPTGGAVAVAGAAQANRLEIPALITTNSLEVLEQGPWSFINSIPGAVSLPYLVDYVVNTQKAKSCSIIGLRDIEAYVALQNSFTDGIKESGVEIRSLEQVAGTDSDFSAVATKIATQSQDCVFISAPPSQGANIVVQLRQAGLDPSVQVYGHMAFASPEFIERGGPAVEDVIFIGDWVPGGFNELSRTFAENFDAKFGHVPDNSNAMGHTAMTIMAHAIREAGPEPTREGIMKALTATKDVPVVIGSGSYSYDDRRYPVVGINVMTIKDGAFIKAGQE